MPERQARALAWLREHGPGLFTYRDVARGTGMTRDQAWAACLGLLDEGAICYVQWVWHWGTQTYDLRSA